MAVGHHRAPSFRVGHRNAPVVTAALMAACLLLTVRTGIANAAARSDQDAPPVAVIDPAPQVAPVRVYRMSGSRLALGRTVVVARDEEVRDAVVVIGGSARIEGRVRDNVVVLGGDVQLGPEADVRGDVVLVGGTLLRAPGARLSGAVSNIHGGQWWPRLSLGWGHTSERVFWSWIGLFAATARVATLALLMAFVLFVARARVARMGRAAAAAPGRAFLVGLAAELLFVPLMVVFSIALALTLIGIPIVAVLIPVAILAAIAAMLLGFTALACHLGEWINDRLGLRIPSAVFATAVGFVIIVAPAFLARLAGVAATPLSTAEFALLVVGATIEFAVWTMGLGATLMTGFGRFATTPPPIPTA